MTVTQSDLPAEFAATSAATVALWIGVATSEVESAKWDACGIDADQGVTLLASHYLKEAGEGESDATGEALVRGETVGEVSTTYSVETLIASGGQGGRHANSVYGRAYDQLLARVEKCRALRPAAYFGSSVVCRSRRTRTTTTGGCGC